MFLWLWICTGDCNVDKSERCRAKVIRQSSRMGLCHGVCTRGYIFVSSSKNSWIDVYDCFTKRLQIWSQDADGHEGLCSRGLLYCLFACCVTVCSVYSCLYLCNHTNDLTQTLRQRQSRDLYSCFSSVLAGLFLHLRLKADDCILCDHLGSQRRQAG